MPSPHAARVVAREAVPFVLGTLFVVVLALRVRHTHGLEYSFLVWNLILAAVPWALSLGVSYAAARRRPVVATGLGAAWLLFLPNAPYVFSDFIHLAPRPPTPMWFDVVLLGSASLTGLAFGIASMRRVHEVVAREMGVTAAWSLALLASVAAGIGVWLGRFERWNSWDALVHPRSVAIELLAVIATPTGHARAIAVSAAFAAFVATTYLGAFLVDARSPLPAVAPR